MFRTKLFSLCTGVALAGCTIAPVDPTWISEVPANARSFAIAQQAVRACYGENALDKFRRAGFGVATKTIKLRNGQDTTRIDITPPYEAVTVLFHGKTCYVGLENMTPEQSAQLAGVWVRAYGAKSNAELGQGLSDHASGAWRNIFTEPARVPDKAAYKHTVFIAAYKTWPYGPYDPQSSFPYSIKGRFPDKPGAAVKLSHHFECQPHIAAAPDGGILLPCSGPDFSPK